MFIDLKILACLALCVVMIQGGNMDPPDIIRKLLMEALFGRDYYDNVPNLMKKDYEGKGKVPYIMKKDYEGKGKVPYIMKKDYEGKGKVPYFKKRDPEGATLERGTVQALADFERETPWSNENGETSHRTLVHHIKDFVGGECGELFIKTFCGLVEHKKEEHTDPDLATEVSRKRAKEEEPDAKIVLDALTVAAAVAHDCLLGQQDAFVGDGRETVDDVATTDTPVFSRKATLEGDLN